MSDYGLNDLDRDRELGSRIGVVEKLVAVHESELGRHRERLHTLEATQANVQLLGAEIAHMRADLTSSLNGLRQELHAFTESKVRTTVDEAFATRSDQSTRAWDVRTKLLMVTIALLGWLTAAAQWPDHTTSPPQVVTVTVPTQQGAQP